ncbi:hypothetical protein HK101_002916 [Irineochytrium annulatum]|nr:hypothetical protein HK101_002916 [Irineochytrium annulatum]
MSNPAPYGFYQPPASSAASVPSLYEQYKQHQNHVHVPSPAPPPPNRGVKLPSISSLMNSIGANAEVFSSIPPTREEREREQHQHHHKHQRDHGSALLAQSSRYAPYGSSKHHHDRGFTSAASSTYSNSNGSPTDHTAKDRFQQYTAPAPPAAEPAGNSYSHSYQSAASSAYNPVSNSYTGSRRASVVSIQSNHSTTQPQSYGLQYQAFGSNHNSYQQQHQSHQQEAPKYQYQPVVPQQAQQSTYQTLQPSANQHHLPYHPGQDTQQQQYASQQRIEHMDTTTGQDNRRGSVDKRRGSIVNESKKPNPSKNAHPYHPPSNVIVHSPHEQTPVSTPTVAMASIVTVEKPKRGRRKKAAAPAKDNTVAAPLAIAPASIPTPPHQFVDEHVQYVSVKQDSEAQPLTPPNPVIQHMSLSQVSTPINTNTAVNPTPAATPIPAAAHPTRPLAPQHPCTSCGKIYKHASSLAKHAWEHTEFWGCVVSDSSAAMAAASSTSPEIGTALTTPTVEAAQGTPPAQEQVLVVEGLTKHQKVQMLEAASVLSAMVSVDSPSSPASSASDPPSDTEPATCHSPISPALQRVTSAEEGEAAANVLCSMFGDVAVGEKSGAGKRVRFMEEDAGVRRKSMRVEEGQLEILFRALPNMGEERKVEKKDAGRFDARRDRVAGLVRLGIRV